MVSAYQLRLHGMASEYSTSITHGTAVTWWVFTQRTAEQSYLNGVQVTGANLRRHMLSYLGFYSHSQSSQQSSQMHEN